MSKGFTLIELLVVIAIIAVLAVVVILTLNPSELLKQARDSQRLSELATLTQAISLYQADTGNSIGSGSTVYVSVPDTSASCANLGLPTLPTGWSYACAATSTYRKIDGTGWIPVNFTQATFRSPLGQLPIDPVNTTSTRDYYTYTVGGTGNSQFELASAMEAAKYKMGGSNDKTSTSGGTYPDLYQVGSSLSLLPIDYGDPALAGYWKFDEGSGTTAYDASGKGNDGSLGGTTPTWASACKVGGCLEFASGTSYVAVPNANSLNLPSQLTIALWISLRTTVPAGSSAHPVSKWTSTNDANYVLYYCGAACFANNSFVVLANSGGSWQQISVDSPVMSNSTWVHVALTYSSAGGQLYINGSPSGSPVAGGALATNTASLNLGNDGAPDDFYMDDIRIYNRALSAAEISAIYNATK